MKTSALSASFLAATLAAQDQHPLAKLAAGVAPSIVTVRIVAELAFPGEAGGEKHEFKQEVLGTVVDKSGLVLVPTSSIDPAADFGMFGGEGAKVQSTVSSLKVVIGNDPKELAGTVVAKDEKLGFSFVKITDLGDREVTPLAFAQAAAVDIGTNVWSVQRLAEAYDFAPFVVRNEISGRIKKPRNAWLLDRDLGTGTPVFTAEGAVGGVVARIDIGGQNQDSDMMMMHAFGGGGRGSSTFVVSAQVVANSVAQALEAAAKAASEKPAEKPAEKKEGEGK